jgi:hypothetical protein
MSAGSAVWKYSSLRRWLLAATQKLVTAATV